jgi:hypothetical protein
MKTHYQDFSTESAMPSYLKQLFYSELQGTACGFMRMHVTLVKEKVTCFYCKRILKKEAPQKNIEGVKTQHLTAALRKPETPPASA